MGPWVLVNWPFTVKLIFTRSSINIWFWKSRHYHPIILKTILILYKVCVLTECKCIQIWRLGMQLQITIIFNFSPTVKIFLLLWEFFSCGEIFSLVNCTGFFISKPCKIYSGRLFRLCLVLQANLFSPKDNLKDSLKNV